jgi:hypothetical protein
VQIIFRLNRHGCRCSRCSHGQGLVPRACQLGIQTETQMVSIWQGSSSKAKAQAAKPVQSQREPTARYRTACNTGVLRMGVHVRASAREWTALQADRTATRTRDREMNKVARAPSAGAHRHGADAHNRAVSARVICCLTRPSTPVLPCRPPRSRASQLCSCAVNYRLRRSSCSAQLDSRRIRSGDKPHRHATAPVQQPPGAP